MKGLFKKLAFAAPLAVCLPLCAQALAGAGDEPAAKIFEDYSLTSATTDSGEPKVLNTNATQAAPAPVQMAPTPPGPGQMAPIPYSSPGCTSQGCTSAGCPAPPNCCNTFGEPFCEPTCVFNAGVEATIFHVQTKGMFVDSFITRGADNTTFEQENSQVFDQITFSPRIWAGVQADCWGIEGRFWYLSDSTNRLTPWETLPAFMTGQYTMDRVKAYTADLEGTYSTCYCGNKLTGFLGVRYASFEAGQGVDLTRDTTLTEQFNTSAFTKFTFNGVGITVGGTGRTPLTCDGCLNIVYGVRGSILWGDAEGSVQTQATVINTTGAASSTNSAISDQCDSAFIIEGFVGVEWDHELKCLPMCAFLRVAFEDDYWDTGKAFASSTSFAASGTGFAQSRASVGDVDTNMLGFTVATGFTW